MSTYWYFECLGHEPTLSSAGEFTQHTDDRHFRAAIDLARNRPVALGDDDDQADDPLGFFERNARSFLVQHPVCPLGLVNEYDEHRALPSTPSTEEETNRA